MPTNISKLLEIRKVTEIARKDDRNENQSAHEQLRSKHIETLEQLQVLSDDNRLLRQDLQLMRKRLSLSDNANDLNFDADHDTEGDAILLRKIYAQDQEIKALKFRISQAEGETRDVKEQSKISRQQEFESRKKIEKVRLETEALAIVASKANTESLEAINRNLQNLLVIRDNEIEVRYPPSHGITVHPSFLNLKLLQIVHRVYSFF
jgi:hypothetical protein